MGLKDMALVCVKRFGAATKFAAKLVTLLRAVRLRPQDAELAELQRQVTHMSQPRATPVDRSPDRKGAPRVGDVLDGWRLEELRGGAAGGRCSARCAAIRCGLQAGSLIASPSLDNSRPQC
jgi:hypothetical protein